MCYNKNFQVAVQELAGIKICRACQAQKKLHGSCRLLLGQPMKNSNLGSVARKVCFLSQDSNKIHQSRLWVGLLSWVFYGNGSAEYPIWLWRVPKFQTLLKQRKKYTYVVPSRCSHDNREPNSLDKQMSRGKSQYVKWTIRKYALVSRRRHLRHQSRR